MTEFMVVDVELDYDYVAGVKYVDTFDTREEAGTFIKNERNTRIESWDKRVAYIREWVNNIEGIDDNWQEWQNKLREVRTWTGSKDTFKISIVNYLAGRSKSYWPDWDELEGFDPPEIIPARDLHIVEVKK